MKGIKDHVSTPLENSMFEFAAYDSAAAEKAGYSNYSYWGSTFRCFLKNKVAMALLILLGALLIFTCIQPALPGQYKANLVIDHPITGMQMMNVQPGLTNVMATVEPGSVLTVTPWENEEWAAVSNVIENIPKRTEFTVLEYGAASVIAAYGLGRPIPLSEAEIKHTNKELGQKANLSSF